VLMGVLPNLFLKPMAPSIEKMLAQVRRGAQIRVQAEPVAPSSTLVQAAPVSTEVGR